MRRIDLPPSLAIPLYFAMGGLALETVGGLLGAPVSDGAIAAFSSIILGTFTAGAARAASKGGGGPKGPDA